MLLIVPAFAALDDCSRVRSLEWGENPFPASMIEGLFTMQVEVRVGMELLR